jgi:hypothetical protein
VRANHGLKNSSKPKTKSKAPTSCWSRSRAGKRRSLPSEFRRVGARTRFAS